VIRERDLNAIYVCGPGHGGTGMVANTYLEGTYGELYFAGGKERKGPAAAVPPVLVPGRERFFLGDQTHPPIESG
jgi:xylulose-5-phosphate/fructose-6-phosphate phosphoketolase